MSTNAAARLRAHRRRLKEGKAIIQIEVSLFGLSELLIQANLLQQWDSEDRDAIARAVERLLILAEENV